MKGRVRAGRVAVMGIATAVAVLGTLSIWLLPDGGPSTLPKATCGSAGIEHGSSRTVFREWDAGALACFRQAATTCAHASLLFTESGADTGTEDVIALRSLVNCNRVQVDGSGEQVGCDDGQNFSIPLRAD